MIKVGDKVALMGTDHVGTVVEPTANPSFFWVRLYSGRLIKKHFSDLAVVPSSSGDLSPQQSASPAGALD